MSDLYRLVEDACAWLDGAETATLSGSPETLSGCEDPQVIDIFGSFRSFHFFRSENEHPSSTDLIGLETPIFSADELRASGFFEKAPERPETPERAGKTPAESTSPLFPVRDKEPETPERAIDACGRLPPDLNTATPPDDPLPISPDDVRAGVARELRALAEDGREGADALRDAVAITAAKIRNSGALAERQAHGGRCHVCDGPLDDSAPVVAVMTGKRGAHLHLHAGCCGVHSARMAAVVDRIMVAAGYGAETEGVAA